MEGHGGTGRDKTALLSGFSFFRGTGRDRERHPVAVRLRSKRGRSKQFARHLSTPPDLRFFPLCLAATTLLSPLDGGYGASGMLRILSAASKLKVAGFCWLSTNSSRWVYTRI